MYAMLVPVDNCPKLGQPTGGHLNTTLTVYDTVVIAWCDHGYHFIDNEMMKAVQCMEYGIWNATIPNCNGQ